ncbi:heterotrimeric G protein alpha subunit [Acrasis kona]|uniref:Heterotrimeric G protein alpha subunit n=1 Tax=Acrasis kona TaxID=1008807 RepID=A0AAW2YTW7_9EUKA
MPPRQITHSEGLKNQDLDVIPHVRVNLQSATDLAPKDANGLSDPFVVFRINGEWVRSSTKLKTLRPIYFENFYMALDKASLTDDSITLEIKVFDWDAVGRNDLEGSAFLNINISSNMNSRRPLNYKVRLIPDGGTVEFTVCFVNVNERVLRQHVRNESLLEALVQTNKKDLLGLVYREDNRIVTIKEVEKIAADIDAIKPDNCFAKLDYNKKLKVAKQAYLLDSDGDGTISAAELFNFYHNNGTHETSEIEKRLDNMDINGDGVVNIAECCEKIASLYEQDIYEEQSTKRVMLYGISGSGKTSFVKAAKYSLSMDYDITNDEELVRSVAVRSLYDLSLAAKEQGREFEPKNQLFAEKLLSIISKDNSFFSSVKLFYTHENHDNLFKLWNDPLISEMLSNPSKFNSSHNHAIEYLFSTYELLDPNQVPTPFQRIQNTVRTSFRTCGSAEHRFVHRGTYLRMFDIGGAMSERKKISSVISSIESPDLLIYFVGLADNNRWSEEREGMKRRTDSLNLFSSIITEKQLKDVDLFVVFTQCDLINKKISEKVIQDLSNADDLVEDLKSLYRRSYKATGTKKNIRFFTCNATSEKGVMNIMNEIIKK